jgi:hypothetical protein
MSAGSQTGSALVKHKISERPRDRSAAEQRDERAAFQCRTSRASERKE